MAVINQDVAAMADVVLRSVRRVLERPDISLENTISELTTDSRRIIRIISEIELLTGIELPATVFASELPIEEIGIILAMGGTSASLVVKFTAGEGEPIFLFPGVSGVVAELRTLAASLRTAGTRPGARHHPIYALAYPGLDGKRAPCVSLAELASLLYEEIRAVAPSGRVNLVGYSAGGCIAVEIARKLGVENVGFSGLIEAPIHSRHWPLKVWLCFILSRNKVAPRPRRPPANTRHVTKDASTRITNSSSDKRRVALYKLWCVIVQRYGNISKPYFLKSFIFRVDQLPMHIQKVRDATIRAMAFAAPSKFPGKATYIKSQGGDNLMCDPIACLAPDSTGCHFHFIRRSPWLYSFRALRQRRGRVYFGAAADSLNSYPHRVR